MALPRRIRRFVIPCLLPLITLAAAACGGNRDGDDGPAPAQTTARVENRAWTQMTVYAVSSGQRVRLGTVDATSTAVLRIPAGIVGLGRSLTFLVDPLGSSRTSTSFEIFVRPGEQITLTIPPGAG